ncbi:MAG: hypothetical protein EBZ48_11375 [Proteobacteria bacterium]|nr:hypothetical protein [Pseudomonadota bacterium]
MTSHRSQSGWGHPEDEWARVAGNPDHLLVSDSIKSAVSSMLEPLPAPPTLPTAALTGSAGRVEMRVSRVERSTSSCLVCGPAPIGAGLTLIRADAGSWKQLSVTQAGNSGAVLDLDVSSGWEITSAVDFIEASDTCIVTVSCTRPGAHSPHP